MIFQKAGYQKNYYQPRRPVKSFQDLEVYQKALAVCVAVVRRIPLPSVPVLNLQRKFPTRPKVPTETCPASVVEKLQQTVLELPELIAYAHSTRFSYPEAAVKKLEEAMLKCNLTVVFLEQYRDLGKHEIETEFFEEQIRNLLACRMKTMHLQMSWKKFMGEPKGKLGVQI